LKNTFSRPGVPTCAQKNGALSVVTGNHQGCGRVSKRIRMRKERKEKTKT
jgi:hypothetical protein